MKDWYKSRRAFVHNKNTLPETNSEFTPENGCLEFDTFLSGARPIFRSYLSFREGNNNDDNNNNYSTPRGPGSPFENDFMEPKYYDFR